MDLNKYTKEKNIEVYKKKSKIENYKFKNGNLEDVKISEDYGVGVRVFENGKMGTAYTTSYSENIDDLIKKAMKNLKYSEEKSFLTKPDAVLEILTNEVSEEINQDEIIIIEKMLKNKITEDIKIPQASYSKTEIKIEIYNNNGLELKDKNTYFSFASYCKMTDETDVETGSSYEVKRKKDEIKIEKIVNDSIKEASEMLGAKSFNKKVPVVLDNSVSVDFLGLIASSFLAENYLKGKTLFKNLDEEYSKKLTIIDDGLLENGVGTTKFDAEGMKRHRTILMENGKIKKLLHNTFTSAKMKEENTGNGARNSLSSVGASTTNLYLKVGEKTYDEIKKDIGDHFLVKDVMGLHMVNQITGEFSLGAKGYYFEKGNKKPIRSVTISGNLKDMLKNIIEVSSDLKYYGSYASPKLVVGGIKITGE